MVTQEMRTAVRYELADTSVELPILSNEELDYFIEKQNYNIRRASLDAAKTILLKLSMSAGRRTVDILSIDNSRSASAYKEALMAYIKSPELSGALQNLLPYAGGISKSDMVSNTDNQDNNAVKVPLPFNPSESLNFFNI